jgi:hypothetical protein
MPEQPGLFDQPLEKEVVEVRLNGVKLERVRRFGDVWLGCKLWRMAKLEEFFDRYCRTSSCVQYAFKTTYCT